MCTIYVQFNLQWTRKNHQYKLTCRTSTGVTTLHRCACWSYSHATGGKLITKGLSQSAMDFQLLFEWWPWNSLSCEICCWEVWKNRNRSGDSFQWTALNTSWIFQWWHWIASRLSWGEGGSWDFAIRATQSLSSYTETSLPLFHGLLACILPQRCSLLSLTFQFPETCRGQKASSERTVNF